MRQMHEVSLADTIVQILADLVTDRLQRRLLRIAGTHARLRQARPRPLGASHGRCRSFLGRRPSDGSVCRLPLRFARTWYRESSPDFMSCFKQQREWQPPRPLRQGRCLAVDRPPPPPEHRGRARGHRQRLARQRSPPRGRRCAPQASRTSTATPTTGSSTGRSATCTTWARPSTPITLARGAGFRERARTSQGDRGGDETLSQILSSVPHAANAKYYAEIVREKSTSPGC